MYSCDRWINLLLTIAITALNKSRLCIAIKCLRDACISPSPLRGCQGFALFTSILFLILLSFSLPFFLDLYSLISSFRFLSRLITLTLISSLLCAALVSCISFSLMLTPVYSNYILCLLRVCMLGSLARSKNGARVYCVFVYESVCVCVLGVGVQCMCVNHPTSHVLSLTCARSTPEGTAGK